MKNGVWDVVPRPEGKSVATSKWIYKIKHAADGGIEKYKRRFMARYTSIRSVLALAAVMKWKIHHMDVNTALLNGVVEEEVYVE